MGTYLNCGNNAFREILNSIYIDKTGLIEYINSTVNTYDRMTCVSRPRRFGKSFAAKMLAAYYDKSCDSRELFSELEISKSESFEKYLNKFDVIYIDVTWFISLVVSSGNDIHDIVKIMQKEIIDELKNTFPNCIKEDEEILSDALIAVTGKYGNKFFIIIDEWDVLFREEKNEEELQKKYMYLLISLFKGGNCNR